MYISVDDALRTEPSLSAVFVNDFYPYLDDYGTIVVPESFEFRREAHELFTNVDYDELSDSHMRKKDILSEEAYYKELDDFQSEFEREFPDVPIYIKTKSLLYAQYITTAKKYEIAGVVQLSDVDLYGTITEFDFLPPEGAFQPLDLESYIKSFRRCLPNVEVDISSFKLIYNKYLKDITGHDSDEDTVYFDLFDDFETIEDITDFIEDQLDGLDVTDEEIKDVWNAVADYHTEKKFDDYFSRMSKKYKLRDKESRALLVYSTGLVEKFINRLQKISGVVIDDQRYFMTGVKSINRYNSEGIHII